MGILSRKRKQPRIVKKRKKVGQKKVNIKNIDPHIRVSCFLSYLYVASLGQKEVSAGEFLGSRPLVQPEPLHEVQQAGQRSAVTG